MEREWGPEEWSRASRKLARSSKRSRDLLTGKKGVWVDFNGPCFARVMSSKRVWPVLLEVSSVKCINRINLESSPGAFHISAPCELLWPSYFPCRNSAGLYNGNNDRQTLNYCNASCGLFKYRDIIGVLGGTAATFQCIYIGLTKTCHLHFIQEVPECCSFCCPLESRPLK